MVMHMDGQEVYKFAVNAMGHEIENVCQKAGIEPAEVDWFLPHQANVRIVDACQKKFKIEKSKVLMNIAEYGNMSATSIMVLLDEFAKKGTFHSCLLYTSRKYFFAPRSHSPMAMKSSAR